ncbi:MAG: hypothetical protein LUC92_08650 [Clostridiales bacterium]|nr:hypothetical protein [Clostridiales bacterium]
MPNSKMGVVLKKKKSKLSIEDLRELFSEKDPEMLEAFENILDAALQRAAEIGAESVRGVIEIEREKYCNDRYQLRVENTKLLLQHYRSLNARFTKAVWKGQEDDSDEFVRVIDLMNRKNLKGAVIVDSIKKSSEKTCVIMTHVNRMLDEYKSMCEENNSEVDMKHWRVIRDLYLSPKRGTVETIAEHEGIHKRTVYKYAEDAIETLTMLLFGVDGIEEFH